MPGTPYITNARKQPRLLLVADDDESFRRIPELLSDFPCGFDAVKNGKDAIQKTVAFKPDLIFLDIRKPLMDGYEVCKRLKDDPDTRHIPILVMAPLDDKVAKLRALDAGANDFLATPVDYVELLIRTRNLLRLKECEDLLKDFARRQEAETEKKTATLNAVLENMVRSQRKLKASYIETIYRLTVVSEYKDEETKMHIKRVGLTCAHIARQLGLPAEKVERITYASPMHDIGKIGIPSDILLKPAALSHEEFALMKTHTTIGGKILRGSQSPLLQAAEQIAVNHHERWDGTGYPAGLKGEEIPIEARIAAIADQYDALRSSRPYKLPFDDIKAYQLIVEGNERIGPSHFDPQLLEIFKDTHKVFEDIYERNKDTPVQAI